MIKNFEGPLNIKDKLKFLLNIWSNMSESRALDWYHFRALL
jgi:hypothetical protein